jgi:hypothetical protein
MLAETQERRTVELDLAEPDLSRQQKLALRLKGRVILRYEQRDGWLRPLPIYASKCRKHGVYEDYAHGWKEELECPACLFERTKRPHPKDFRVPL